MIVDIPCDGRRASRVPRIVLYLERDRQRGIIINHGGDPRQSNLRSHSPQPANSARRARTPIFGEPETLPAAGNERPCPSGGCESSGQSPVATRHPLGRSLRDQSRARPHPTVPPSSAVIRLSVTVSRPPCPMPGAARNDSISPTWTPRWQMSTPLPVRHTRCMVPDTGSFVSWSLCSGGKEARAFESSHRGRWANPVFDQSPGPSAQRQRRRQSPAYVPAPLIALIASIASIALMALMALFTPVDMPYSAPARLRARCQHASMLSQSQQCSGRSVPPPRIDPQQIPDSALP